MDFCLKPISASITCMRRRLAAISLRRHLFLLQLVTLRLCLGTRLGGKGFTTHSQQPHGKKGYDGEKKCAMSVNFLH